MTDIAMTAPKKLSIPSYSLVLILAVVIGLAGVLVSPLKFLIVIAGILLVGIALYKTEFALALIVLAVPMTNARVNLGPIPLDAVTITAGIAIISYALHHLGKKETNSPLPYTWAFILFLVISFISAIFAPSTVESVAVIVRFIGYFLLIMVIGRTIKTREALTWILVLMVVAGALTGLYGIYQYMYAPDTAKIGLYDLTEDVAGRVGSTFENPNFYAEYLVLLVPIGLALVLGSRGWFRRLAMIIATLLLFAGLILTYTRGSWLATGVGIAIMSVMTEAWLIWVWAALFALALLAFPGVASRFASITDVSGGTAGFRRRLWSIALGIIQEHPLIGIGIGNYYDAFTEYIFRHPSMSVGWVIYGAHNSYLTFWAETGIFGILSFVAIILIAIKYGLYISRAKAQDKYLSWINSAIFAGIIGFSLNSLTSNSFHHPQGALFFWFLLGLQVAVERMTVEPTLKPTKKIIEDSLILRPILAVLRAFGKASSAHHTSTAAVRLRKSWGKSSMLGVFDWFFRKPYSPAILTSSGTYRSIEPRLERFRVYIEQSSIYSVVRNIGANPFVAAGLFIIVAFVSRTLAGAVIG